MTTRDPHTNASGHPDDGSVTPLVIGMMLCLLILGAGVTAAGSAFLAGQRLQHLCDGAAAAATGSLTDNSGDNTIQTAIDQYFALRNTTATTTVYLDGTTLTLTCGSDTVITFGALFATPTLHRTVTASARTNYRQN